MTNKTWKPLLAGIAAALTLTGPAAAMDGAAPAAILSAQSETQAPCREEATLPLRATFEGMGWTVTWDAGARSASLSHKGHTWTAAEGGHGLTGATTIPGCAPNRIVDGVFRLPKRAAARLLESARQLEAAPAAPPQVPAGAGSAGNPAPGDRAGSGTQAPETPAFTQDELFWLARIIEAEAGGEPMEGKIAVGNTILNRVRSADYPDTIYGVIFDRNWGVQYTPTSNGTIWNDPSGDAWDAARRCLEGENLVEDCLFFLNPRIAKSFWIVENREYYCTIGGHDFYR